ncbi:MAG TPA: O-antigen ligase family protein [Pyrinomonadaceae bacterium]|nr:O-antigen ligase family protein [Pyrinomonadaceae bacterium]
MRTETAENPPPEGGLERLARRLARAGFVVYAVAAPHSIAGSWMGLSAAVLAWALRFAATRRAGVRRTPLDLPLWLFAGWTVLSCLLSAEPRLSVPKLVNVATFLMFYLAQGLLTRRACVLVAAVLIASGSAGALWGAGELVVGRGVVVAALADDSPLRAETPLREGDAVWRVNGRRVSSAGEIDEEMRRTPAGARVSLSVISHGEHVEARGESGEWRGVTVTEEMRRAPSPSGITGDGATHSFRASGWTRHYETFAEVLQIVAQLALGFALAGWRRREDAETVSEGGGQTRGGTRGPRGPGMKAWLPAIAFVVLALGIALTAMRTTLVAFAFGACVVAWRASARGRQRALIVGAVAVVLCMGAVAVWRTRAAGALRLDDASANTRLAVARTAASRVPVHPVFGHGMDAVHAHWNEWGFPGSDMLHAHSTPVQLAFDRGLPALVFWLWLMLAFLATAARAEALWRDAPDASAHGLALGTGGALAGFLASSLVNYNFGDAEVALLVWWMMGVVVTLKYERRTLNR